MNENDGVLYQSLDAKESSLEIRSGRTVSILKIICFVSWCISVNLGLNVTFILAPPLLYSLGLNSIWVNVATSVGAMYFEWITFWGFLVILPLFYILKKNFFLTITIGPIFMGFQPILGAWSDNTRHRFGRRKPFIVIGMILSVFGMISFANTRNLAEAMKPLVWPAVAVSVISLILINAGFAAIQSSSLALMFDNTYTEEDKNMSAAFLSAAYGLASVLGYSLGYIDFRSAFPFFHSNTEASFYVGLALVLLGMIPTLIIANSANDPPTDIPELKPLLEDIQTSLKSDYTIERPPGFKDAMKLLFRTMISMDSAAIRLFAAWFMACAAGYPWVLYFTAFMGQDVYKGNPVSDPHTPMRHSYEDGVRLGSLALGFMGIVTVLSSFACDPLVSRIGYRPLWFLGHVWAIVSLVSVVIPPFATPFAAVAFCIVGGVYNGVATAVPYALLGIIVGQNNTGLYAGIMNLVNTLAQLVAGAFSGGMMQWCSSLGYGAIAPGIAFCAVWAILGIPIIFALKIPDSQKPKTPRPIQ